MLLHVRISFQKFLNIDIGVDNIPDETTILNFRHLLEKHKLSAILFNEINNYLQRKEFTVKEGTVIDATCIILLQQAQRTRSTEKRDSEMRSAK